MGRRGAHPAGLRFSIWAESRALPMKGRWLAWLRTFLRAEDGPSAVEYAVLLGLIVCACMLTLQVLGFQVWLTFVKLLNAGAFGHS
jgi:pilus assembly protein Flp/PilA